MLAGLCPSVQDTLVAKFLDGDFWVGMDEKGGDLPACL